MPRILIVGGGLAGLYAALKLAPLPVTLVSAPPITKGSSSAWAQGGIAAALGPDDSLEDHIADTVAAGGVLVKASVARKMVEDAPARIDDLAGFGVPFDRTEDGDYLLGREGAHSHNRIVRVSGDRAGAAIMDAIKSRVRACGSIDVLEGYAAYDLEVTSQGEKIVRFAPVKDPRQPHLRIAADHAILATGGIGGLYAVTTNPREARGEGLAMAARAGALLSDIEFVQFHPTGLDVGIDPAPLASEALRGEGAFLINDAGDRFMTSVHALAELAPRDIVARAIHAQIKQGHRVFLDARAAIGQAFPSAFPTVYAACRSAGLDPVSEPMPVAPAAHYHMGGIDVDETGQTSIEGLWASGELACTGIHGANRLASNSLLETLYLSNGIAERIKSQTNGRNGTAIAPQQCQSPEGFTGLSAPAMARLRRTMALDAGVVRTAAGLEAGLAALHALHDLAGPAAPSYMSNAVLAARLIVSAALARTESRGAHFREDHPLTDPAQAHQQMVRYNGATDSIECAFCSDSPSGAFVS